MVELVCRTCGTKFPISEPRWRCDCGAPLDLEVEATFDPNQIDKRVPTMWRYREAIPVEDDRSIISFDEGFTPLVPLDRGGLRVLLKQEHLFRTGSFKDRGASVLVSKLREWGVQEVVEDSSGNAGCAIAAYCKRAGIRCTIYVPESTSKGKVELIERYGASLVKVPGSREDTARQALMAAEDTYYASHAWNPFFLHGTKTFAYEICEQLGCRAPDSLVLPVGNGTLLLGALLGFSELISAGIVERMPRLIAVQAESCAPLERAFREGSKEPVEVEPRRTVAEGIAVAEPVRGRQILRAVRESGGEFVTVTDDEILAAQANSERLGFDVEPTGAVGFCAVSKILDRIDPEEIVVTALTGHGKKELRNRIP
jgi:threonine synthase